MTEALESFAENTMRYLREEGRILAEGIEFPELDDAVPRPPRPRRRPGDRATRRTCGSCEPYVRDFKPVLVGVDGGADALLDAGYRPDVIVGDMDSVSDDALRSGAELVVHAYRDGARRAPARADRSASRTTRCRRPAST